MPIGLSHFGVIATQANSKDAELDCCMKKKLKSIVDLRTGYQFRGKVVPDDDGDIDVIQIKDIDDRQEVDVSDLTPVTLEKPERHFLQSGDVLFLSRVSRGHSMYGTVVPELQRNAVASSYFFVLRPKSEKVLPRYLAWSLSEPRFQRWLRSFVRGTQMTLVSLKDFADLQVNLPDLHTQQQIVRLNELMLKEAQLLDQLKSKRAELIEGVSRSLLSGRLKTKDE